MKKKAIDRDRVWVKKEAQFHLKLGNHPFVTDVEVIKIILDSFDPSTPSDKQVTINASDGELKITQIFFGGKFIIISDKKIAAIQNLFDCQNPINS